MATAPGGSQSRDVETGSLPSSSIAQAHRFKVIAAFAAIYTIWGSTYLAIKISIETIPPFLMASLRFLIAGGVLYAIARLRGAEKPAPAHWKSAAILGSLMFLVGNGALTWAELKVPSGLAALLLSIIPLWMVLLHHLEMRRRLSRQMILGLALGLAGIGVLVGPRDLLGGGRVIPSGAVVLILGSFAWAVGSLLSRRVAMPKSSLLSASMEMLAGGAGLMLLSLATGEGRTLLHPEFSLRSILALGYLVSFGSLVGFTSYHWLLGVSNPSRVATYAYVNPVIAIFIGWALGDELLNLRVAAATFVIISAVALIITHQATDPAEKDLPPTGDCPETVV